MLVPKSDTPQCLSDFRPISMVGCVQKVISKLLAIRLGSVIHSLIGECQNAFIKGRQILDEVLIASEVVEAVKKAKEKTTFLKLDFCKAFDSVD